MNRTTHKDPSTHAPARTLALILCACLAAPHLHAAAHAESHVVTVNDGDKNRQVQPYSLNKSGAWMLDLEIVPEKGYSIKSSEIISPKGDRLIWKKFGNPASSKTPHKYRAVNAYSSREHVRILGVLGRDGNGGGGERRNDPKFWVTVPAVDIDWAEYQDYLAHEPEEDDRKVPLHAGHKHWFIIREPEDDYVKNPIRPKLRLQLTSHARSIRIFDAQDNEIMNGHMITPDKDTAWPMLMYAKVDDPAAIADMKIELHRIPFDHERENGVILSYDAINCVTAPLEIFLKDNGADVPERGIAYVSDAPMMPRLTAQVGYTVNGVRCFPNGGVKWKMKVDYTRNKRADHKLLPAQTEWREIGDNLVTPWIIYNEFIPDDFFGGRAEIDCEITIGGQAHKLKRTFGIRGTNPPEGVARDYIDSICGEFWYAYAIAKHESRRGRTYLQFNEINLGNLGIEDGDIALAPNLGAPDGWGIMQIDNIQLIGDATGRKALAKELWSWMANCDTGVNVLKRKKSEANAYFQTEFKGARPDNEVVIVDGHRFSKNDARKPFDLEVMHRYNGKVFWTDHNERDDSWEHVDLAGDYTEDVMKEYEGQ